MSFIHAWQSIVVIQLFARYIVQSFRSRNTCGHGNTVVIEVGCIATRPRVLFPRKIKEEGRGGNQARDSEWSCSTNAYMFI